MADLAYHHDSNGKALEGSIDVLIQGIAAGRQVRAVVQDPIGMIAYNSFSTVRVLSRQKLVVANLPIRPATDDSAYLFGGNFALSVATIDSTGKYTRHDGLGADGAYTSQFEVRWFLDKA